MTLKIRWAEPSDAPAVAAIHVRAWQTAYRGLLSDGYLDGLSIPDREMKWRLALTAQREKQFALLALGKRKRPVGFSSGGPTQDKDTPPGTGEIYAIYLEPDVIGTGAGRELFSRAMGVLRVRGFTTATLWVLEANERARRFYEAAGWRPDGSVTDERIDCQNLPTIRYQIDFDSEPVPAD